MIIGIRAWRSSAGSGGPAQTTAKQTKKSDRRVLASATISTETASWIISQARTGAIEGVPLPGVRFVLPNEISSPRDSTLFLTLYPGARAIESGERTSGAAPALPNERALRVEGTGADLHEGTSMAVNRLREAILKVTGTANLSVGERSRIKLDVLTGEPELLEKPENDSGETAEDLVDAGADGIQIDTGKTKAYLMPSDLIYDGVFAGSPDTQNAADLLDRAMTAAGLPEDTWRSHSTRLYRFQTISYMEEAGPHPEGEDEGDVFPVVRGFVKTGEMTRQNLVAAARSGGDYLVRAQDGSGQFVYLYDPLRDAVPGNHYNIIRHAGTAVALFDLYKATKDQRYLTSAVRAVDYLKTRFRPVPQSQAIGTSSGRQSGSAPARSESGATASGLALRSQHKSKRSRAGSAQAIYVLDYDGKSRLGANGLALLALTREIQYSPRPGDLAAAKGLANSILAMQRQDGGLEMYYRTGEDDEEGYSLYYPGEAMLGLIELYRIEKDPRILDAVSRGADFLIQSQRKLTELPPDAWFVQTLEALYAINSSPKCSAHAIDLAFAMATSQYTASAPEGFEGAIPPGIPRATPAASRAEGTLAGYRLAVKVGDQRASQILAAIKSSAAFQLSQQFNAENSFFLPDPQRAMGGFHESLTSMRIRIDYVQHNISSLLGLSDLVH